MISGSFGMDPSMLYGGERQTDGNNISYYEDASIYSDYYKDHAEQS